MKNYGRFTTRLIIVWFVSALAASALHLFRNDSERVGVAVAIAAMTPILVFALWFAASKGFRQFILSLDPVILTAAQSWRIIGFTFVLLQARSVLPTVFALPAGYGDMAIGATAAYVAWKLTAPTHRNAFILWQVLGITDLVVAVTLGTTARLLAPHEASMLAMTVLPLSLVPTVLVPVFLFFHIICIAQAKAWKAVPGRTNPTSRPAQHATV
jgi:hypothetical protein